MKDFLKNLYDNYNFKYSELVEKTNGNAIASKWGYGVLSAFSIVPYASELLGYKPGRMLKKTSEPGVNRHCYFLDEKKRIIEEITYARFVKIHNQWIVYRNFFLHDEDGVVGLFYHSHFENGHDTTLSKVVLVKYESGRVKGAYTLTGEDEYSELDYIHNKGNIEKINLRAWSSGYFERFFVVESTAPLVINEQLSSGEIIKIYPS